MYKLIKDSISNEINMVRRLSDGACIPFAEANRDYQEFLAWKAEGNEPEEAE